ncbi:MAG: hypothetical protein IH608_00335 [Proteobacteria bacterium]|nr:hypothetical protein [Pseudomonadota bacterium]
MRPHPLFAALLLVLTSPGGPQGEDARPKLPTITAEHLSSTPNVVIVDVRRPEHWDASELQIAGAWRGPPGTVQQWSKELSPRALIVLYCDCPGSATSARVAEELVLLGFRTVYVLEGGWSRWSAAGFPVEKRVHPQNLWAPSGSGRSPSV